jgi:hypothetical protein
MKMLLLTVVTCLIMVSCVEPGINFEKMSEAELAAYNEDRPMSQMMVCSKDSRSFSRVKRRRCFTVAQMYGSEQQAGQLGVLDTVPGIGVSSGEL